MDPSLHRFFSIPFNVGSPVGPLTIHPWKRSELLKTWGKLVFAWNCFSQVFKTPFKQKQAFPNYSFFRGLYPFLAFPFCSHREKHPRGTCIRFINECAWEFSWKNEKPTLDLSLFLILSFLLFVWFVSFATLYFLPFGTKLPSFFKRVVYLVDNKLVIILVSCIFLFFLYCSTKALFWKT